MTKRRGIPSKGRRLSVLKQQQAAGAKQVRVILVKRRAIINSTIVTAVAAPNYMSSAAVRNRLYKNLRAQYMLMQAELAAYSRQHGIKVARVWRALGINDVPGSTYSQTWAQFSRKYLDDIIALTSPNVVPRVVAVNARLGGMLQQDIAFLRKGFVETQRIAALEGWNRREIGKEMLSRVTEKRPAWQFIDSSGRRWQTKNYFQMLNKTVSNNVARESYLAVMAESRHDLATIEGGPSTIGDSCDDWVGRIVSISGATPGYPTVADAQASSHMFGPNCNHWLGVVLAEVPDELSLAKKEERVMRERIVDIRKAA